MFAFVDALAKVVLSGLPEQSVSPARRRERYDRFIKSAAARLVNGRHPSLGRRQSHDTEPDPGGRPAADVYSKSVGTAEARYCLKCVELGMHLTQVAPTGCYLVRRNLAGLAMWA
jgi:hypothetical protein